MNVAAHGDLVLQKIYHGMDEMRNELCGQREGEGKSEDAGKASRM